MPVTETRAMHLHYTATREIGIRSGKPYRVTPSAEERFCLCLHADVTAAFDESASVAVRVAKGELFYLPSRHSAVIESLSSTDASLILLSFRTAGGRFGTAANGQLHRFRLPQMRNWSSEFVVHDEESPSHDYWLAQSRLYAVASAYARSLQEPRYEVHPLQIVERAKQAIHDNYEGALDMDRLARSLGASPNVFYRSFREHTGLSPLKYLTAARLEASLRLLADPDMSVAEAAHSVGYSDEYYFSRLFKKQMRLTPTEYASRAQVSIASLSPIFVGDLSVLGLAPRIALSRDWDLDEARIEGCIEEIGRTRPDFIVSGPLSRELHQRLETIAPVTILHWFDYSWKSRLLDIGDLFGLRTVAERWLADYERKVGNARRHVEISYRSTPYLLVGVRESGYRVYGKQRPKFTDLLYDELKLGSPPAADGIGFLDASDVSEISALGNDHVLFIVEFPASDSYCEQLAHEWRTCSAPQNGCSRDCLFVRLEEPFLYNAAMHGLLVDQIVGSLAQKR